MEKKTIYLTFHVGRGGRFFNQGHLTFIGAYDFQWVINNAINDGKAIPDGCRLVTETGRVLLEGRESMESMTGVLDLDGDYDTDYTTTIEDLNEREKDAIRRALKEKAGVLSLNELSLDITDFLIEYEGVDHYVSDDRRFVLTPSKNIEGCWVCADTEEGIVVVFKEHHFEDDRNVTVLFNSTESGEVDKHLNLMQEWLECNHFAKVSH